MNGGLPQTDLQPQAGGGFVKRCKRMRRWELLKQELLIERNAIELRNRAQRRGQILMRRPASREQPFHPPGHITLIGID